MQKYKKKMN